MTDVGIMFQKLLSNFSVTDAVLLGLLVVSEVLGTNEKIKSSSIYVLLKTVLVGAVGHSLVKKEPVAIEFDKDKDSNS